MTLKLILPYPPSVNHYWGVHGKFRYIAKAGKQFRNDVVLLVKAAGIRSPFTGWLSIHVLASAPDRRRRDLDNITKALLDALAHAGVYEDDKQISELKLAWFEPGVGQVHVDIEEMKRRYVPLLSLV